MGAGGYGAGSGPAGFDPVLPPSARVLADQAGDVEFDLATRSYPKNADGTLIKIHYVDQQVMLALGIVRGRLRSVPTIGIEIQQLANEPPPTRNSAARTIVDRALDALIKRGDVEVVGVVATMAIPGRIELDVAYRNLRLRNSDVRTLTVTPGSTITP